MKSTECNTVTYCTTVLYTLHFTVYRIRVYIFMYTRMCNNLMRYPNGGKSGCHAFLLYTVHTYCKYFTVRVHIVQYVQFNPL